MSSYDTICESMIVQLFERVKYLGSKKLLTFKSNEKIMLKISWNTWLAGDASARGLEMFLRMFKNVPETQEKFHFLRGSSSQQMQSSSTLIFHVTRVVKHINMALDNLDNLEDVVPIYRALGKRHAPCGYNIPKHYFPYLGTAMRQLMKEKLRSCWTTKHEELWTILFGFIVEHLQAGIDQATGKAE